MCFSSVFIIVWENDWSLWKPYLRADQIYFSFRRGRVGGYLVMGDLRFMRTPGFFFDYFLLGLVSETAFGKYSSI